MNDNNNAKPFYITTAIAYTSKKPHIGNNYEIVITDAIARMKRLQGFSVFFMTGTDEHGQKIAEYAADSGLTPKEHVDSITSQIKDVYSLLNISFDKFIRTTDPDHKLIVQKIFKRLFEQGDIYQSTYNGWYCKPCESFLTQTQVKDGCCPDCGTPVKEASEEAYFFRMSKYQDALQKHIDQNPSFILPESRKREMVNNFLTPGLQDLCVSRTSFSWGIPVPFNQKHVVYVWLDALSNYISGIGYDPELDFEHQSDSFKHLWPAHSHVIGKDILRFHSIYWPIFLMALGLPLPHTIFAHPWMLFGQDKMSKSKGNLIFAEDLADIIGVDAVRYYMLSEMPYSSDCSISYESVFERYNSDLANTIGNLVNRSIAMSQKYSNGVLYTPDYSSHDIPDIDSELTSLALASPRLVVDSVDNYQLASALEAIITLVRRANKYIDESTPWILAKNSDMIPRLNTVLYNLAETIRFIAVLLQPFTPATAQNIFSQLNISGNLTSLDSITSFGNIPHLHQLNTPSPLFQRLDTKALLARLVPDTTTTTTTTDSQSAATPPVSTDLEASQPDLLPISSEITIDTFASLDLRVALVLSCEKIPKSDKLLQLSLFDGFQNRQIVSGIAPWYSPEQLVDKKIIIVANLKPAKLRGVLSQGMLLAADDPLNPQKPIVVFPDQSLPAGTKIR